MKTGSQKQAIVLAVILLLVGFLSLISLYVSLGAWVWVVALGAAGALALVLYLADRESRSLLLTAYILLAIALLIAFTAWDVLRGEAVAAFVLIVIAVPFLITWLRDRAQWWALIPAYVMLAVALMLALQGAGILSGRLTAPYVLFCVAIPFFYVYARNTKQWWYLIPAGVVAIVGLSLLIATNVGAFIIPLVLVAAGVVIIVRLLGRGQKQDGG